MQPLLGRGRLLGAWHGFIEKGGGRGRQSVDASCFLAGRANEAGRVPHGPLHLVLGWLLRELFTRGKLVSKDSGDGVGVRRELDGVRGGEYGGELEGTGRAFDDSVGRGEVVRLRYVRHRRLVEVSIWLGDDTAGVE